MGTGNPVPPLSGPCPVYFRKRLERASRIWPVLVLVALTSCGPRWRPAPGSPEAMRLEQDLALFPESYDESRARFRQGLDRVQRLWPNARLCRHRLDGNEDLTIGWIEADALERKEKLLVLTSGQHGVEAFVGSAMLQLFAEEFLPRLEPRRTGLLVVHAINPWGMKHGRRTNAANVDLNRNFLPDPASFDEAFNPDYARLNAFLNPTGPIPSLGWTRLSFSLASARRAL